MQKTRTQQESYCQGPMVVHFVPDKKGGGQIHVKTSNISGRYNDTEKLINTVGVYAVRPLSPL